MNSFVKVVNDILYKLIFFLIVFYQRFISSVIPARCRYYPTCSTYGKQALAWHGVWIGGGLLLKRLSRCHPLGGHGIDFVPLPLATYYYHYVCSSAPVADNNKGRGVYRDYSSYVSRLNYLMRTS